MDPQAAPYVTALVVASLTSLSVSLYAWSRHPKRGAASLTVLMLAGAVFAFTYAMQIASRDLPTALFWYKASFPGAVILAPAWFVFAIRYTDRYGWLTWYHWIGLGLIPLMSILLGWTSPAHDLYGSHFRMDITGPFPLLRWERHLGFWLHGIYAYVLTLTGSYLLIRYALRAPSLYRGQVVSLFVGVLAPMIGNLIHVGAHFLHVPVLSQIDLAPLTLPITGVAWAWALFRFRLLEVMPVARQAIMEEMGDGIVVVDIENCVIYANPAMLTLLARPASKVIGQPAANVLPPWLHLPVSDRHAASSQEEVVVPDDENARHFDRRTLRLENSRGRPTGWMTLVRDITQRKQAEIQRRNALEAQRQSEQRFRKIFEGAQIGVVMINQHGAIQAVNPFMCQWLGYSKAAMQSLTTEDITYPPDIPRERRLLQEMRHGERNVVHLEKRYVRSDGEIVWGDLVTNLVYDEEDHYLFGLGTVVDVTDRKQAQQRLEAYAAELKRSNEELEQFGYVVSHDLREPLRMVASYLELLETRYGDTLEERAKVYMDFAVDGARRMQAMIKALLDLSRVETRGNPFTRVDAGAILTRTLTSLSPMIEENQAVITHDPLPSVAADEAQLAQVFQNLIVNAIKFQREGVPPRIHISADRLPPSNSSPGGEDSSSPPAGEITGGSPDGGEWRFSVTDNGIGIDPEQADRLFRIFQRLHTADEYPGLGLGLALCKRIITRHGGRIWIESEPGEGATFVFTIPTQRKDL